MSKPRLVSLHGGDDDSNVVESAKAAPGSALQLGLDALAGVIEARIERYLEARGAKTGARSGPTGAPFPSDIPQLFPEVDEPRAQLLLWLALVPHLRPDLFESIVFRILPNGGDLPILGGVKGASHRGLLPTGETAQFVLAGEDLQARIDVCAFFEGTHPLGQQGILTLESVKEGEPVMSGRLLLAQEWVDGILFGASRAPHFGADFAARRIETAMHWDDAVLHPQTRRQVDELALWLAHRQVLLDDANLGRKIKPGYRVLFHGPSGTGKTLTAALLGKRFGRDVYRVDLSQVVSKYIGETEKNLEGVFRRAQTREWILFFDEADALFGKRTSVQSAHDKYANQEVSYLLQRVEDFPGMLILASNYKNNLDDAFLRRFHALVHFPLPTAVERLALWNKSLPAGLKLEPTVDLQRLAKSYEMTGASILNAVQFASLQALARGQNVLGESDLMDGIRREFMKEEKSL